jgi:CheY-like chemotaxis protein/DNA-directed RNA polymerase specialized sigma24 family protein
MSANSKLVPHLPYLRRYARALTGSQESGDSYVRAALTALLSGEQAIDPAFQPRVGLYRVFHKIWSSTADRLDDLSPDPEEFEGSVDRLRALASSTRAVLLLTAVESFSLEEAGAILDEAPGDVERAAAEAQLAIERGLASRVLIIEDEPIIALDLENLMVELGHVVVGKAASRDSAVKLAHAMHPGLILADINLGEGGSGIDAVSDILNSFNIPVIFITAYPEKLLIGERPEPTYLIAKPFFAETVQATVGQALFCHTFKRQL